MAEELTSKASTTKREQAAATFKDIFGKGNFLSRDSGPGAAGREANSEQSAEAGAGPRHPAGRDQRQPLPVRRRCPRAGRDGVHPDGQVDQRHQPPEVRQQPVLTSRAMPRWRKVSRDTSVCWRARWRLPNAAISSWRKFAIHSHSSMCPRDITSRRLLRARNARRVSRGRLNLLRELQTHGPAEAFARGLRAAPVARDRDHPADAIRWIFPDRVGFHPLRQGAQHSSRSGPWIGSRRAGGLCARHHRHRSTAERVAVRALPESRTHQPCPTSISTSA